MHASLFSLLALVSITLSQPQYSVTQYWFYESDQCSGSYVGIIVEGGKCIQCLSRNADGLFYQIPGCANDSTRMYNCTGDAPYYDCQADVFATSKVCAGTEFVNHQFQTGRCTPKGTQG